MLIGIVVPAFAAVLAAGLMAAGVATADVFVGFQSPTLTVAPGDTFTVSLLILQAGAQFNAFDASVRFDPSRLSFDPITPVSAQRGELMTSACGNTFHNFSAASDSLKITLSLLCGNTFVTGPGRIYRVRLRAGMTPGTTTLSLGSYTEFYRAGLFVRPLNKQDMVVQIGNPTAVDPDPAPHAGLSFAPPAPNPRRGTGAGLLDFTLPAADVVSFDVLDLRGRRIAGRDAERFEGGRHRLSWAPPAIASGEYFVRLRARSMGSVVQKWTVLR